MITKRKHHLPLLKGRFDALPFGRLNVHCHEIVAIGIIGQRIRAAGVPRGTQIEKRP